VEGIGICLSLLAMIAYRRTELALARGLAHESLLTVRELGARWVVQNQLVTVAAIAGALGAHEQAVSLMAASHTFSKLVDVTPIPLAETFIHEALDGAVGFARGELCGGVDRRTSAIAR
jgi:hypothetical protein